MGEPNRWLHVRHPRGFDADMFELFRAQCRIWRRYVEAVLEEWQLLEGYPAPAYEFFEPELSDGRTVATLPVGGEQTLGSRVDFENAHARLLWERFPIEFNLELEEGLTEREPADPSGKATNWRPAMPRP